MREIKVFGSATKVVSLDEFFAYLETVEYEGAPETIYKVVAWIYRCVQLRANAVARIPYKILRGKTEQDFLPLRKLLWDTEAALNVWGAAYWLKKVNAREVTALQWLNPSSMEVKTSSKGINGFEQRLGSEKKTYKPQQIVYFRLWNPENDLGPGVAPAQVALEAAGLARNANRFASKFFEHGAIPAVILEAEGRIDEAEQKRITSAWEKFVGGVANAFRTLALGRGMKANIVGATPGKDLAMAELMGQVRQQIAVSFGIPQTLLEDAASFATAKEHRKSLYTETVIPQAEIIIQEALNIQLFRPLGLEFVFEIEQLEIMQEEERDRAESVLQLVRAGCTLEGAFAILGIDIPEGVDIGPVERPVLPGQQPAATLSLPEPGLDWTADLKLWEKKSLRYLEERGFAIAPFKSERIPQWIRLGIITQLGACETEQDVKRAFASAFGNEDEARELYGFLRSFAAFETERLWPGFQYVQGSDPPMLTDGQGKFYTMGTRED